jgi:hypothetical protein
MVNKSSNYMVIQISFTLFLYYLLENSFPQEKTEASKFGIKENVFKQLHYLQFLFGVFQFNRTEILYVEVVMEKSEFSLVIKLDLRLMQKFVNSRKKSPIPLFLKNHWET